MLKIISGFILLLVSLQLTAQDINYARSIIHEVCSRQYAGRGYAGDHDSLAAEFIVKKLQESGVKPLTKSYFQSFPLTVNVFPDSLKVSVNGKSLIPGEDFLIAPFSGEASGNYPISCLKRSLEKPRENMVLSLNWKRIKSEDKSASPPIGSNQLLARLLHPLGNSKKNGIEGVLIKTNTLPPYIQSKEAADRFLIVAKDSVIPRNPDSIHVTIDQKLKTDYKTQNIAGFIPGKSDSFIVFTAHYDHVGMMGKETYFPGAHDNASGTAMVLDLARHFNHANSTPKHNIAFIFFSGEELGLLGSQYFVEHPVLDLAKIKFLLNLDLTGSGGNGITVVNATEHKKIFNTLKSINNTYTFLPRIKSRGPAKNGDHWAFHQKGVPCFFIYTNGQYTQYHNIYDTADNVPLTAYNDLVKLIIAFTEKL